MTSIFKNRNFTLLFFGRLITNAGDSLYYVAAMWLVYELGGSSFYTGLAGFLTMFPSLLQFLFGPLVDRWPLKRTLLIPEILQGVFILIIPLAYYTGWLNVATVLTVMPILSLINQLVYPAQQVALPRILDKDKLVQGNSALSFAYQGIDMVFNGVAGIIVAMIGAISLFMIDSITFAIAAILFASMKIPARMQDNKSAEKQNIRSAIANYKIDLKEGFAFLKQSAILKFFAISIVANFTIGASMAVLPAYSDWRGGAEMYGALLAALSAGVLIGALLASVFDRFPLGRLTTVIFTIGAALWLSSIIVPWNWLSIGLFGAAVIPVGITNVMFAAALQRMIPEHILARVFSIGASISTSATPLGSLLGGLAASIFGHIIVIGLGALGFIFLALYFLIVPFLRRLPATKDLTPEVFGITIEDSHQEGMSDTI